MFKNQIETRTLRFNLMVSLSTVSMDMTLAAIRHESTRAERQRLINY